MKAKTKINILLFISILSVAIVRAQSHRFNLQPIDSLPCVVQDSAYLYFPGSHKVFDRFYTKLTALLSKGQQRINVLHIGGSHVQAGHFSGRMRSNLVAISDSASRWHSQPADRGLVFPFKVLRTNAPSNYSFSYTGQWFTSRCISQSPDAVLGLAGAAAITRDSTATLTLSIGSDAWQFSQLHLLGYASSPTVYPVLVVDGDTIYPYPADGTTGYLFPLPRYQSNCTLAFVGLGNGESFTVRGMLPFSGRSGITYSESGVNGAAVPSWLRCAAFGEELALLPPDLVVFGIGINDAACSYDKFNPETFKQNYRDLIACIRKVNPNAALLFITNNDCYQTVSTRRYNANTPRVEQAFKELATEYDGCVFNVFRIMGGPRSAGHWVSQGLMQRDRVHFTKAGYTLIADLLYNAIVRDYQSTLNIEH